jgi:chromosome segregation ATPase
MVPEISPEFMRAIQREIESAVETETRKEREQATIREADVTELGRALEVLEKDIADLREQLSDAVQVREQLRGRLESQLEYVKQCEGRIEQLREQVATADRRAAVAEAQALAHAEIAKEVRQRLVVVENRHKSSR